MAIKRRDRDREGCSENCKLLLWRWLQEWKEREEKHIFSSRLPSKGTCSLQLQLGSGPQPRQNRVLGEASSSKGTELNEPKAQIMDLLSRKSKRLKHTGGRGFSYLFLLTLFFRFELKKKKKEAFYLFFRCHFGWNKIKIQSFLNLHVGGVRSHHLKIAISFPNNLRLSIPTQKSVKIPCS